MESHSGSINTAICPSCNGGNDKKARFCVHCGNPLPEEKEISVSRVDTFSLQPSVLSWQGQFRISCSVGLNPN